MAWRLNEFLLSFRAFFDTLVFYFVNAETDFHKINQLEALSPDGLSWRHCPAQLVTAWAYFKVSWRKRFCGENPI